MTMTSTDDEHSQAASIRASEIDAAHDARRSTAMATMFDRYGGFASVSRIVMQFYDAVLESPVAGPYFDGVDMKRLIDHQTKFIAQVMGGPVSYGDEALRRVHAAHRIDQAAFDEVVALLAQALEDFGVSETDIDHILSGVVARAPVVVTA